jgi:hypothetical protein
MEEGRARLGMSTLSNHPVNRKPANHRINDRTNDCIKDVNGH